MNPATPPTDEMLTVRDMASLLRITTRAVHAQRSRGKLPNPIRIGRLVRWRRAEVERWLLEKQADADAQ